MLNLKIALYVGLVIAAPVWLYQLWAFIAPGLHRRERRYSYAFAAVATPLFAVGVRRSASSWSRAACRSSWASTPTSTSPSNLDGYFDFVTGVMLLFGVGVRVPVLVLMLNFAGAGQRATAARAGGGSRSS